MSDTTYTVETIPAGRLKVDQRVQRDGLKMNKVQEFENKFNPDALGVIYVSRRGSEEGEADFIIDGWHRDEVAKRKDPNYPLTCHVFRGLTVAEEALMFLDLNRSTPVSRLEKFKVSLEADDPTATLIDQITRSRGWTVSAVPANGNINAVAVLERIHDMSQKVEANPHLLDATLMVVTRAWGADREGTQSVILEGIASVIAHYGDQLNLTRLYEQLRERDGGPRELHDNGKYMARSRKGRTAMGVAELVVDTYNKGAKGKKLPNWGKR